MNAADTLTLRREPQQARSRARLAGLLDAAETLLVREGAEALTTTRIAAEAGVSVGSLYRWFPDKAAIVDAITQGSARHSPALLRSVCSRRGSIPL